VSRAWKRGSSRAWRKLRAEILLANLVGNQGMCTLKIPTVCAGKATQVHHTLGRATTGDDPRYLAAVCQPCNLHVGEPEANPDPPVRARTAW